MLQNENDIIWKDLLQENINTKDINKVIEFDIINGIKCFLTDSVNSNIKDPKAFDPHANLKSKYSFQHANDINTVPVVNVYVSFLKELIEQKLSITGIPLWPKNKKYAIGLSHDVDNPEKYAMLNAPVFLKGRGFKENLYLFFRKMTYLKMYYLERQPEDYWLFDKIMELENSFGFKSTFYFASQNIRGEWSAGYDVPYDIRSERFLEVFENMKKNDFEIGLHAGYYAHQSVDRFISERKELEKVSNSDIKGLRHHYWSMGNDIEKTLDLHDQAGFSYDSSISFNDGIGFRRSTALPYYPWNHKNSLAIDTLQLPVFFMDSHFEHPSSKKQVNKNVETVKNYITSIKKYQGIGIIDYHVRTSYPADNNYKNWATTYQKVLSYLSKDPEIWVDNLANISNWLKKRKAELAKT
jgi:hypothetical protein